MNKRSFFIVGKHAVLEALRNPKRRVVNLFLNESSKKALNKENHNLDLLENVKLFYKNNTYYVKINGKPGAGVLTSLSGANGLIEVGENTDNVMVGDIVNFIPFKEALL